MLLTPQQQRWVKNICSGSAILASQRRTKTCKVFKNLLTSEKFCIILVVHSNNALLVRCNIYLTQYIHNRINIVKPRTVKVQYETPWSAVKVETDKRSSARESQEEGPRSQPKDAQVRTRKRKNEEAARAKLGAFQRPDLAGCA